MIILCDDYTGCDKVDDYFPTEVETIIDSVYEADLNSKDNL